VWCHHDEKKSNADSVRIQFSASIGAIIKGVEDAKSAILLAARSWSSDLSKER
jgi:hypothetical protein